MDALKKINFARDRGLEQSFPEHAELDKVECERLRRRLSKTIVGDQNASGMDLLQHIRKNSEVIEGVNAKSSDFSLGSIAFPMFSRGLVYINWYRFDKIDIIDLSDLDRWFEYIWYPSVDDIEIFDLKCNRVLSIRHDGLVSLSVMPRGA